MRAGNVSTKLVDSRVLDAAMPEKLFVRSGVSAGSPRLIVGPDWGNEAPGATTSGGAGANPAMLLEFAMAWLLPWES